MKVKVVQAASNLWYADEIGTCFAVYDTSEYSGKYYRLVGEHGHGARLLQVNDVVQVVDKVTPEQPAPRKFAVGDKVKIVKKVVGEDFYWADDMYNYIGKVLEVTRVHETAGTYQLDNKWHYLPESLELVEEEESVVASVHAKACEAFMKPIDSHYNFNYSFTQRDYDMGSIKLDPYFVAKQWDLGSKDTSGVIFHIFKTCARFGEKNDKAREIKAIYKSIKRLAELEGVTLE